MIGIGAHRHAVKPLAPCVLQNQCQCIMATLKTSIVSAQGPSYLLLLYE